MAAPAAAGGENSERKDPAKKPPIETASWCYRDKEDDVHHDFAWTITNFSRKINVVPNSKFCQYFKNIQSEYRSIAPLRVHV